MLFNEIYGAYYQTVASILNLALTKKVTKEEMENLAKEQAFSESFLSIVPSLLDGKWQLINDGRAIVKHSPTLPLTELEKRWLKAISLDPRVKLFDFEMKGLDEVTPLFTPSEIVYFDQYSDGDDYEDEKYQSNFHLILKAIKESKTLELKMVNRNNIPSTIKVVPEYLEYSEKDDKFRLLAKGYRYSKILNLSRIISVKIVNDDPTKYQCEPQVEANKEVSFELVDKRNSLERVMLHFAHFEKEVERIDSTHYQVKLHYCGDDETEIVIRVLSFGSVIKVTEPIGFVELIKNRLIAQKNNF